MSDQFSHKDMGTGTRASAEKLSPAFARVSSRVYDLPGCAHSIYTLWNAIADGLIGMGETRTSMSSKTATAWAAEVYDFPWWYVPRGILEFVQSIEPPDRWMKQCLRLGFPATYFLLPKGAMAGDSGEDVAVLSLCFLDDDVRQRGLDRMKLGAKVPEGLPQLMIATAMAVNGVTWHIAIPIGEDGTIKYSSVVNMKDDAVNTADVTDDTWISRVLVPAVLNLAAFMAYKPGHQGLPSTRRKVLKSGKESWTPRVVTSSVSRSSGQATGTGSKMKPHVRGWHWHTYLTGPERANRELRLLEPIFVNSNSIQ